MEEIQFNKLYNFDKERLYSNFERIQNLYKDLKSAEIITKFLFNQSIGGSINEISDTLKYYQKKLFKDKGLLDFAFEWIRAYKIRLEYKRYINLKSYKEYTIALDDAIFLFFLRYDEYLRTLFEDTMEEYEFSTLYRIFFTPKQSNPINLTTLLEKYKEKVPTIIIDGEKIDTKVFTLREGLSDMIKEDYHEGLPSDIKIVKYGKEIAKESDSEKDFDGTMIERLIKFYCFQKRKIDTKEFTMAINQFLSSYFQFGTFYEFNEFKEKLMSSFINYIRSGLTENYEDYPIENLKNELSSLLEDFGKRLKQVRLKGKAWTEDLKPILQYFIEKFVEQL
jgi:hypothetical protein